QQVKSWRGVNQLRVEPKCEQTIFSRSNYQFWFATRRFGNYREVSRYRGRISANSIQNGLSVRFGSDDSGTPLSYQRSRVSSPHNSQFGFISDILLNRTGV